MGSGSLRIIGIQIFEETDLCIRKVLDSGWYPFIKCNNDIGINKELYPEVDEENNIEDFYTIYEELPQINVSAIVGRNGSGKSSLLDILHGIINNFSLCFLNKINVDDLEYVYGIYARLFFTLNNRQKYIDVQNQKVTYFEKNESGWLEKLSENSGEIDNDILSGFFYTISFNYSLYGFNPDDRESIRHLHSDAVYSGQWIYKLYHKTDGYYIPLVFAPSRGLNGEINISNENDVAAHKLSAFSLLFESQKRNFIDGYDAKTISYKLNRYYEEIALEKFRATKCPPMLRDHLEWVITSFKTIWERVLEKRDGYSFSASESCKDIELFYLGYKVAKLCLNNSEFKKKFGYDSLGNIAVETRETDPSDPTKKIKKIATSELGKWLKKREKSLERIILDIIDGPVMPSTAKIHHCLYYLKGTNYKDFSGTKTLVVDTILVGKQISRYYDAMFLLPPPFVQYEIHFEHRGAEDNRKPEITFSRMSSGERQMYNVISNILYNLYNISLERKSTIKEENAKSGTNASKRERFEENELQSHEFGYNHINLIFDEAELYFHPEFQRRYLKSFLDKLRLCHIDKNVIKSINILIVTHSPFILSDIPSNNILFLPLAKEERPIDRPKTFGGNIYDLLKESFFLESAIGDIAQLKLKMILDVYYNENFAERKTDFDKHYKEFRFIVSQLGDEYLHDSFNFMLGELEKEYLADNEVTYIDDKINRLNEEIKKLEIQKRILRDQNRVEDNEES